jgi:hypothetical protein
MNPARIVQKCYVVKDLEEACRRLHAIYRIGPFVGGVPTSLSNHVYRGISAPPVTLNSVFVQSGELNIELIQLISDGPSAFSDMFSIGDYGFHHVAMFSDNYGAERDSFVAAGFPVASEFSVNFGATICHLDARPTLGHMIELYPENAIIRDMYRQARDAAVGWTGKELIIPWAGT